MNISVSIFVQLGIGPEILPKHCMQTRTPEILNFQLTFLRKNHRSQIHVGSYCDRIETRNMPNDGVLWCFNPEINYCRIIKAY